MAKEDLTDQEKVVESIVEANKATKEMAILYKKMATTYEESQKFNKKTLEQLATDVNRLADSLREIERFAKIATENYIK